MRVQQDIQKQIMFLYTSNTRKRFFKKMPLTAVIQTTGELEILLTEICR